MHHPCSRSISKRSFVKFSFVAKRFVTAIKTRVCSHVRSVTRSFVLRNFYTAINCAYLCRTEEENIVSMTASRPVLCHGMTQCRYLQLQRGSANLASERASEYDSRGRRNRESRISRDRLPYDPPDIRFSYGATETGEARSPATLKVTTGEIALLRSVLPDYRAISAYRWNAIG